MSKFKYEIYMPAGDIDYINQSTPIAACDAEKDMLCYVALYWYGSWARSFKLIPPVEGPIEVRINK
jgi:hypothetical protein